MQGTRGELPRSPAWGVNVLQRFVAGSRGPVVLAIGVFSAPAITIVARDPLGARMCHDLQR
jgi:hypothetical protein